MPLISSRYSSKGLFRNPHFSTIYSARIRPKGHLAQERRRISLPDGDFIDLDLSFADMPNGKLAVLLHGLEGNAQRVYVKWQALRLLEDGWNICAVNYRGCSGQPNLRFESYNAGKTDDLEQVILNLTRWFPQMELCLVGFSLGGNLLLKYLGEPFRLQEPVKAAVAISSPLDLRGSLEALSKPYNWIYRRSFLNDLRKKYRIKVAQFPDRFNGTKDLSISSLLDFDNKYTAPAHGFDDAWDYYNKNSSLGFIPNINIPVLILNAQNDTFLSPNCFPYSLATESKNIYLETPKHGGHVGFFSPGKWFYSESRTAQFLNEKT